MITVVIAIIAILASMLLPALSKARQAAQNIKCVSNVKQMVLGAFIYANDNDDKLPGSWDGCNALTTNGAYSLQNTSDCQVWWADSVGQNWMYQVWKSGIDKALFRCPANTVGTHSNANWSNTDYMVGYMTPRQFFNMSLGAAKRPSEQCIVLDRGPVMLSYYQTIPAPTYANWAYTSLYLKPVHHGDKANMGYIDGHAASTKTNTIVNDSKYLNAFTNN